jgi:hypothetical protein
LRINFSQFPIISLAKQTPKTGPWKRDGLAEWTPPPRKKKPFEGRNDRVKKAGGDFQQAVGDFSPKEGG